MESKKSETEVRANLVSRLRNAVLVDGAIDLAVSHGILESCAVRVERHGKTFIERGYRIADEKAYEDLIRLTYGAEEVKLRD